MADGMCSAARRVVQYVLVGLVSLPVMACASVDVVRLTSQTFPPKDSADQVEALDREPTRAHLRLAELRLADTGMGFDDMQRKILKKAATLGADAVVFSKPETEVKHQVAYEPTYSPWGYYGPYYGPGSWGYGGYGYGGYGGLGGPWGWGGGYTGSMAMPYDVTVNSLTGTAVKYTDPNEPGKLPSS